MGSSRKGSEIPFNLPFLAGKELRHIREAVTQGQLSGDGPFTQRCHEWLERELGCCKALLTHSCTGALEMAALLAGVGPGDEVIMPSFTFVSTANAFVLRGAVPVFVDIHRDTLNLDERLLPGAVTKRTRAIVPVHYAGLACAMDGIMEVAGRHRLLVVEDAAQALLSTYKGRPLGTIGHLGCVSFHETKNIISGEGGALLVNDSRFAQRAEIIREKGTNRSNFLRGKVDKYTWVDVGSSYLPGELTAAFLFAQFEKADYILAVRTRIFQRYMERLEALQERGVLRLPHVSADSVSNGHMFHIVTRSLQERTRLIDHLRRRGIGSAFHYVPLHSSPAGRKFGRTAGAMTVTDSISACLLRLPIFYGMKDAEVDRVAGEVLKFYARA